MLKQSRVSVVDEYELNWKSWTEDRLWIAERKWVQMVNFRNYILRYELGQKSHLALRKWSAYWRNSAPTRIRKTQKQVLCHRIISADPAKGIRDIEPGQACFFMVGDVLCDSDQQKAAERGSWPTMGGFKPATFTWKRHDLIHLATSGQHVNSNSI